MKYLLFTALLLAATTQAQNNVNEGSAEHDAKFDRNRVGDTNIWGLTPEEMALYDEMMAGRDISSCGCTNNDPHVYTYDGVNAECQGKGDYIYSKSTTTDFMVQARFSIKSINSWWNAFTGTGTNEAFQGTSTKGGVVYTGVAGEPKVEAFAGSPDAQNVGECEMEWYFDDVKQASLGGGKSHHGHGIEDLGWGIFWRSGVKRYIFFRKSGLWMEYEKWEYKAWGCSVNVCVCPSKEIRDSGLIGILGSADGNPENDYMTRDGTVLEGTDIPQSIAEQNDYCNTNWCLGKNTDENIFKHPIDSCDAVVTQELDIAIENVSQELKELCLFNRACILDSLVSGDSSLGTRTLETEKDQKEHVVDPERHPEDEVEGDEIDGLPFERFTGNKSCKQFGFDFGWKTAGCVSSDSGNFKSDVMTLTSLKSEATCDASTNPGSFELECSGPVVEGDKTYRSATVTPSVDTSVKIRGNVAGGVVYKELKAGQTYTLEDTSENWIEDIEFCFNCADLPEPVCPQEVKTCPDGSFVGRQAPSCEFRECPSCPADTKTCPDGTVLSRDPESKCDFGTCPPCGVDSLTCPGGETLWRRGEDCQFPDCPTPDADNEVTTKAFTKGDPHFMTFGNEMYDYHGECDLVLLKNPLFKNGLGMEIHIRTKISDWWSAVETAAVKIGDEVLEITGGGLEKFLWINGNENEVMEENKFYKSTLSGLTVRSRRSGIVTEAHIYFGDNSEKLIIKTFKNFVRVDIEWQGSKHYEGSTGLLGSLELNGSRVGRDGKHIASHNEFGQAWQVREDEAKLFHSNLGTVQAPNKCILPAAATTSTKFLRKRRLAESGLTMDAIEIACGHLATKEEQKGCVDDVVATQDMDMAAVW